VKPADNEDNGDPERASCANAITLVEQRYKPARVFLEHRLATGL